MVLFYSRINWENFPSVNTALNAINLNAMDYAVKTLDERTVELDTVKANQSVVLNTIQDWSMDEETGIITITKVNGEQIMFDLNIEKIPVKFELSEDGILSMTTDDGTVFTANIGSMIPVMTFENTDTILVKVVGEGKDKTFSFEVKDGSITEEKLQPNYLADIKVQAENASMSATASAESATASSQSAKLSESYAHGGTGARDGEDTDNAKYYSEEAKKTAEYVESLPDGINRTTESTLVSSKAGGLKVNSISGESQQKQYSGKNLYDSSTSTFEILAEDGTITTATNTEYILSDYIESQDDITVSTEKYTGTCYIRVGLYDSNKKFISRSLLALSSTQKSITVNNTGYIRICYENLTSQYLTNVQVEDGSTATDYEPYVGNQPSPNPIYPQEIESVEVGEIKAVGKNLWPHGNVSGTLSTAKTLVLEPGTYTISALVTTSDTDVSMSLISITYEDGTVLYPTLPRDKRESKTVNLTKRTRSVHIYAGNNYNTSVGDTFTWADIQIEKGSTATAYEPYHEKAIQLSNPITLRGIGDVKDTIVKQDGVYGVLRKIVSYTFTGNEPWSANLESGYLYGVVLPSYSEGKNTDKVAGYCTHLQTITRLDNFNGLGAYGTIAVYGKSAFINYSDVFTTRDEYITWLSENSVEVTYPIASAGITFKPLPTADQIALHQLETFDTVTYISTDSEIEPVIEVEYGTSKVGAYALKGMNDVEIEKLTLPVNNLLATVSGKPLDATQGKVLDDKISAVSESMGGFSFFTNPTVVYLLADSTPYKDSDGNYVLAESETGAGLLADAETYYSDVIEGDYRSVGGADSVTPFKSSGGSGGTLVMENNLSESTASNTTTMVYAIKTITITKNGKVGVVFTHFTDSLVSQKFTLTQNGTDVSEEITKNVATNLNATHGTALLDCETGDVITAISTGGYSSKANRYATVDMFYLE